MGRYKKRSVNADYPDCQQIDDAVIFDYPIPQSYRFGEPNPPDADSFTRDRRDNIRVYSEGNLDLE
jgi:hypothetical protein